MYISRKLVVRENSKGKSLYALDDIMKDELLIQFDGAFLSHPTKTSLQVDEGKHLEGPGEIDDCLNHSCSPNGYINFETLSYRALRDVKRNEEMTFNYLTTEWDMANKFQCDCGTPSCLHDIRGFKYLTLEQKRQLKPYLSPFLAKKLAEDELHP